LHRRPSTAAAVEETPPAASDDGNATTNLADTDDQTLARTPTSADAEVTAEPVTEDPATDEPADPATDTADPATDEPTTKPVGRKRTSTRAPSPTRRNAREVTDADATESDPVRTRSPLLLPLVLLLVAAALAGLGFWFQTRSRDVHLNEALVDTGGTTEVSGQAREAVEKAFSYNFADVTATEKAANELLVGKAKCQYNAIFGPVKTLAPEQKLVVTVRVVSSGVTSLEGDRATVLLFIDQVTTRTTDNQTGGGIAMMRVGAQRSDGRWKVDNMEMFGQTGDQSAEMQKCADAK
jgi:Mce-associated membrane protein